MKKQLLILMTLFTAVIGYSQSVGDTFVDNFITYEITSLSPDEVEAIDYNTAGGTIVTIPNTVQNNTDVFSVTSIGVDAFRLKQLTDVTISGSVETIKNGAFDSNNNMVSATIQNGVIDIQNSAFFNTGLTSIIIPDSVTSIGQQAFDFTDISNVNFGNGLITIGLGAFRNTLLTSITIPSSVTSIGSIAFENSPLVSVTSLAIIPPDITTVPTADTFGINRSNIDLFIPFGTLNDYVTNPSPTANWTGFNTVTEASASIGDTFIVDYITYEVTSVSPETVEAIDYDMAGGTVVDIPASVSYSVSSYNVTSIGGGAFQSKNLTDVTIPNSITTIEISAFHTNQLTDVILPESVTSIGPLAFISNPLNSVVSLAAIPPTITTNNSTDTFAQNGDRSNIDLVIINNATDEYVTDPGALWTGFKMVFEATSPTTIEVSNYDPANGTNVVIPASVTAGSNVFDVVKIDNSAFENIGLTSVIIPNSVTNIGISAFNTNNLTSVTIPDSVTIIGTTAFATNPITNLSLGANVADIGIGAFVDNNLTDVTIPSNVTFIGLLAFGNNPLASVTSFAVTPPTITTGTNDTFAFNRSNIHLHIPPGTMGAYVTDSGALWTGFNPVTEDALSVSDFELDNNIKIITTTDTVKILASNNVRLDNYTIYSISGQQIATGRTTEITTSTFANGIYILKLKFDKGTVTQKFIK
ncbi:leucine-rich repeat domain-containing protein [Psychroserpens sp. SPM9]|uniref:leucine-rich repeat domain-containing protein n=1 Tax=Psychroserpens sp. SPM9 TaxID=2975598 RepID=UPI0021A47B28|nr:leucine-rich repeat domain-containing protein [Psychroserpens sp. SPM9]MDG5492037.1 leucine-rich repeat domain-containing protein [Psychroserpens sp. SPM9]